ncbi:hypothetical protein NA57DRAFT_70476 [Rhizodiscina lignyota]|uniref:Uncharacterized protein n=1 Tax=Rhizodiscina lignyota TaxID=1504668 RepID=A0A9P4MB29_9PEZI|nr:hypothetical protein NA57DRAFT_70476 [Rhizodiscina lignyota]
MFHRRKASNPLKNSAPDPSAASAATQAFINSQNSNVSLSSAAAAAALRSHTPPPTNPADIQTKRMVRRDSSSSKGSAAGRARSPAGSPLQRTNSNGSMTERSFRSPSPNRKDVAVKADPSAPPVPALPNSIQSGRDGPHVRSASVETPQNPSSPRLSRPGGRGRSVDAITRTQHPRVASLSQLPELDTTNGGRRSVNFSRPMSPGQSPSQSNSPAQPKSGRSGWFTAPVGTNAQFRQDINDRVKTAVAPPAVETGHVQQSLQSTANMPVAKKKKRTPAAPEGMRLSQAINAMDSHKPTMVYDPNTRKMVPASPPSTVVDPRKPTVIYDPNTRTVVPASAAPVAIPQSEPEPEPELVPEVTSALAAKVQKGASPTVERAHPLHGKATAVLTKQPSIVREETEEDEQVETEASKQHLRAEHLREASAALAQPTPTRPTPQDHRAASLNPGDNVATIGRSSSLSPSRTAHFSAAPVTILNGVLHSPPPRSLSPAKPALKQSPASSVRTGSPITSFVPALPKPASRDVSVSGSEEGSVTRQKKKSARVSFGDDAVEIIPDTTATQSGMMSSRYATHDVFDDDDGFEMSPRPVLPSFGSIRGRSRQAPQEIEPPIKVTESIPSSMSTSVSTIAPESLEHSSDHAVGGILAKHLENRKPTQDSALAEPKLDPNEPLPPEVTSVEGTGYVSDSDASEDERTLPVPEEPVIKPVEVVQEVPPSEPLPEPEASESEIDKAKITESKPVMDVPVIEIQPATPGATESEKEKEDAYPLVMPGGFAGSWLDDDDDDDDDGNELPSKPEVSIAKPEEVPAEHQPPAPATEPPVQRQALEPVAENSSDESIYSDAEEELSDLEPYASLDAIVESPIGGPASPSRVLPESSPLRSGSHVDEDLTDWNKTKAYWSGLSVRQREELEKQAKEEGEKERTITPERPRPPKGKKKKAARPPAQPETARLAMESRHTRSPDLPREEYHLRTSLRNRVPQEEPQRPETHLRQSLRTGGNMPSSMRGAQGGGLQTSRYSNVPAYEPRSTLRKNTLPMASASAAASARPATAPSEPSRVVAKSTSKPYAMPLLLRSDSDASDSSFKRARLSKTIMSDGERYTMRHSMRGAEPQPIREVRTLRSASPPEVRPATSSGIETSTGRGKRFSLRSLSPPGTSTAKRSPMRSSLDDGHLSRPSTAQPTHRETLRTAKSPTRFSMFNKETKGKAPVPMPAPMPVPAPPKPTLRTEGLYKSRYADDSDDDSPQMLRPTFRSRFADSDDEDDSPTALQDLTPVRGIPRKPGHEDGDSTDLEDESGGEAGALSSPKGGNMTNGNTGAKTEGSTLAAGSMRGLDSSKHASGAPDGQTSAITGVQPKKEKRSFFGIGRKKKTNSLPPQPTLPPMSAANVDTKQTAAKPSERAKSPKLQRRTTPQSPQRVGSGSWPLHPPQTIGDDALGKASSVDAAAAPDNDRPDVGQRRSTVDGSGVGLRFAENDSVLGEGAGPSVGSKKKKKFGALRRAFKLDD